MRKPTSSPSIDVCLLLEGTYPYVSGGVSTWVHQLVTSLPDVTFEIVHIGAKKSSDHRPRYEVPDNVVGLRDVFLEKDFSRSEMRKGRASRKTRLLLANAVRDCLIDEKIDFKTLLLQFVENGQKFTFHDFWTDPDMWDVFNDLYEKLTPDFSFKDFFWNARAVLRPIWNVLRACEQIDTPKVFFTACTGYAGMLASILSADRDVGFLLSEHGIYVRERLEEMRRASWISEKESRRPDILSDFGRLKSLWMNLFCEQATMAYEGADQITSLFERNANIQKEFGAPAEKITIVPNGVGRELLDAPNPEREPGRKPTVGFLGRVVPIKDIKSLLRAAAIVVKDLPDAQFIIAGPTDEEPAYYHSCIELARQLDISENIHFAGTVKPGEFLCEIDVNVLSSVSEGMPFSILEGFAIGVPAVSTDVGACRELIEGREEDPFGHAGIITPVREPSQLAEALVKVLTDEDTRAAMSEAARKRVNKYYVQDDVIKRYLRAFAEVYRGTKGKVELPSAFAIS